MTRRLLLATTCLVAAAGLAGPAAAQSAADIQRLEAQIQSLQQQLNALKAAPPAAAPAAPAAAAAAPANAPKVVETAGHRFGLESADGSNSIYLTGRVHADFGGYTQNDPAGGVALGQGPGSFAKPPLKSGVNLRRARLGVTGKFMDDWAYTLIYEFGGTSDGFTNNGTGGTISEGVENAFITYNGFYKQTNRVPVAIDIGYMDIPWTLDETVSSNDIMFIERSSAQSAAVAFGGSDFRSAVGARSNNNRYWAGVYLTGPTLGSQHAGDSTGNKNSRFGDYSVLARGTYNIINNPGSNLHVGVNVAHMFHTNAANDGLSLGDRPEVRIDPTTIQSTGAMQMKSGDVYGAELAGQIGHFFAMGEYYHYVVSQRDRSLNPLDGRTNLSSPDLDFDGGYLQASYSIGGKRKYNPGSGSYTGVIPEHPVSLKTGGWGALEFAARFSALNLNDHYTNGVLPSATGGVMGGDQKGYSVGVNWYLNNNMRFMLDYMHEDINDKLVNVGTSTSPLLRPAGGHYSAVAGRMQFNF